MTKAQQRKFFKEHIDEACREMDACIGQGAARDPKAYDGYLGWSGRLEGFLETAEAFGFGEEMKQYSTGRARYYRDVRNGVAGA